ncbi:MAG: winged helix-turn-helix transcriptional regulator [Puniceicoccaceae bacterium]
MALKSQDLVVALKLCLGGSALPYADLSRQLLISASEVHAAVKRLEEGGLIRPGSKEVLKQPLLNLIQYGIAAVFPAKPGEPTRGIPTAWASPALSGSFQSSEKEQPVWPDPEGSVRGNAVVPLHPSVPKVAKADSQLYALLAMLDAVRIGRARERNLANELLKKELLQNG